MPHNRAPNLSRNRAEYVLQWLANLSDPPTGWPLDIFRRRFPELREFFAPAGECTSDQIRKSAWGLREHMRAAWDAPDIRAREWYIFKVRDLHWRHARFFQEQPVRDAIVQEAQRALTRFKERLKDKLPEGALSELRQGAQDFFRQREFFGFVVEPPPPLSPLENLLSWFQRNAYRARHCANPECPAPYFFAQRRGQKYHKDCTYYGQREAQKRYWNTKGKARRQAKRRRRS